MIRYYKLFDLLNRRNMNKSSLLNVISSKTIAKLSKGENITTDVIEKICIFLQCQPGDIMEITEIGEDKTTGETVEIAFHNTWENEFNRPEPDNEARIYKK